MNQPPSTSSLEASDNDDDVLRRRRHNIAAGASQQRQTTTTTIKKKKIVASKVPTATTPGANSTTTATTASTPPSNNTNEERRRIKRIVWRDFTFLILALIGCHLMSYVELNASDATLRGGGVASESGLVDTGFIATTQLYLWLKDNQYWNDILAAINSIALLIPGIYTAYITVWKGDFDLAFRYFATHLLRSFCGWFTYLPPDPTYLPSNYDFPDIWQCVLIKDCSQSPTPEVMPFVSFFSGHVSTMVCTANHMYVHNHKTLGVFCHILNVLQVVRLLATRGHYSIDMIIAWYVAVYVSNPAGRLGRYYSRGKIYTLQDVMPSSAEEAFETITGTADIKMEARVSKLLKEQQLHQVLMEMKQKEEEQEQEANVDGVVFETAEYDTAFKLAAEGKLDNITFEDMMRNSSRSLLLEKQKKEVVIKKNH